MRKSKQKSSKKKGTKGSQTSNWLPYLGGVLLLTLIAMIPVFSCDLINYDDELYITENPFIQNLDIQKLFTEFYANQYSPLAMLLMALQFKLGFDVGALKTISVLLHLLNTFFVFLVIEKCFGKLKWAAFVAVLFGVAPLQIESVAWLAASMKIGTYALFFLTAIWTYLRYIEAADKKYLIATFALFLASCLCKEQAVALAPTLIALDYLKKRNWFSMPVLIEKIPFFALAILFGILTLQASYGFEAKQSIYSYGVGERLLFAGYALGAYFTKLTIPYNLSFFYTYPIKGQIPVSYYLYTLLFLGMLAIFIQAIRTNKRVVVFALLFFGINIGLTIFTQILSVRDVIMADRYVYISSIGWFIFLAYLLETISNQRIGKNSLWYAAAAYTVLMAWISFQRGGVWENSIRLFSDVIKKEQYADKLNPYLALPYNNRGIALKRENKIQEALQDFERSAQSNASYPNAFLNRGNIYFNQGKDEAALQDYNKVLSLTPNNGKALSARGAVYAKRGQLTPAFQDLNKAIELEPYLADAISNRALLFMERQEYDKAIADFTQVLSFMPNADDIYSSRGVCYSRMGQYPKGIQDQTAAIKIKPNQGAYYLNRSVAYKSLGNKSQALQDAQRAQQLGSKLRPGYMEELQ